MSDPLEELQRRRLVGEDAARPEKVEKRHSQGGRTARENIADLLDEGSFVEYGRLATAAQEKRHDLEELMRRSPADGLIGGLGRIDGQPCAVLSYDYLVMAGTQGVRGHHKSDRLLGIIEKLKVPTVFFTEGGEGGPATRTIPSCRRWMCGRSPFGPDCPGSRRGSQSSQDGVSRVMPSSRAHRI